MNWLSMWLGPFWLGFKTFFLFILLAIIAYLYYDARHYRILYNEKVQELQASELKIEDFEKKTKLLQSNMRKLEQYYKDKKELTPTGEKPKLEDILKVVPE